VITTFGILSNYRYDDVAWEDFLYISLAKKGFQNLVVPRRIESWSEYHASPWMSCFAVVFRIIHERTTTRMVVAVLLNVIVFAIPAGSNSFEAFFKEIVAGYPKSEASAIWQFSLARGVRFSCCGVNYQPLCSWLWPKVIFRCNLPVEFRTEAP
jgi:hypothetical protein